ncbi:hypothetical protein OBBRIDRAFT_787313, partial [Obba rivulosa]
MTAARLGPSPPTSLTNRATSVTASGFGSLASASVGPRTASRSDYIHYFGRPVNSPFWALNPTCVKCTGSYGMLIPGSPADMSSSVGSTEVFTGFDLFKLN